LIILLLLVAAGPAVFLLLLLPLLAAAQGEFVLERCQLLAVPHTQLRSVLAVLLGRNLMLEALAGVILYLAQ
jgi:hypothetical protein